MVTQGKMATQGLFAVNFVCATHPNSQVKMHTCVALLLIYVICCCCCLFVYVLLWCVTHRALHPASDPN